MKYVLRTLSQRKKLFRACILTYHVHFQSFSFLTPVPFSCPYLTSLVPSLTSLYFVSHPMSPVLRPLSHCTLLLVSRPLSPVSLLCSLSPVLCTLSLGMCSLSPILLSPSPHPYQLSQCPLFCGSIPLSFCSSVSSRSKELR